MSDNLVNNSSGDIGPLDGVFLDFYGTVAGGDRQAIEDICQAIVDDHGLELSANDLAVQWGLAYFKDIEQCETNGSNGNGFRVLLDIERATLIETLEPLAGVVDVDPYVDCLNQYLSQPELFPEIKEALSGLSVPVCIVSNADQRELLAAVEHHSLAFHHIVTSESACSYKPNRRIFDVALAQTGWSADRVIHIGDSLHSDVGGAHQAGIRAVWLERADRISDIGTETPEWVWNDLFPLLTLAR